MGKVPKSEPILAVALDTSVDGLAHLLKRKEKKADYCALLHLKVGFISDGFLMRIKIDGNKRFST